MSKKDNPKIFFQKNSLSTKQEINFTQEILKQLQQLDTENYQLKEALTDLEKDLKEKDQSIEESQKIISKLKEEYTKVIKELQNMEKSYNQLLDEMNKQSIEINYAKKNQSLLNILKRKNDSLSNEKNNLHKENILMRKKILSCGNISCKNEKDMKNKDIIIENLQNRNKNMLKMLKDRESIIDDQNKKIKELNEVINSKNEEMKILMNISKEINKENKINVKELTKQAVKTIKAFQNNNNKNTNANRNNNHSVDFNSKIFLSNNKTTFEDFENIFKNNKGTFSLEDTINEMLYIPDNLNKISKEFLVDMNFKTELIKNELYSGLIREKQFIDFLKSIFGKIFIDNKGFLNLFQDILKFKNKYLNLMKENYKMKKLLSKSNISIKYNNNKDNISEMEKIKENIYKNNILIKNKFMEKQKEIQKLKNEIKSLNSILMTNSININRSTNINSNSLSNYRHLSNNHFKKRVKSLGEFGAVQIWNTLPTQEGTNNTESNISKDKDNTLRDMIINKDSTMKTKRISKKICQRKSGIKKLKNLYSNINNKVILDYNKSLENETSFKTENNNNANKNISNDTYYNNTMSNKNDIRNKPNNNYKRDIFSLQKEINNILMKNYINNSIINNDTNIRTPKNSILFSKIKIKKENNNEIKNIFSDRMHKKITNISILESNDNGHIQHSQIIENKNKEKRISLENNFKKYKKYSIFNCDFFINLFFKMNNDIFDVFELNKYRQIYNLSNINNIYLNFKRTCNELKNKTDEINLKINKSHYLSETKFMEKNELKNERKNYIDKSFKFFNERIISLKKFEFEFINMNDYIKNYLVSQEITIKIMYNSGKKNIRFEPIEKLFNLFEDCLTYRINEMNENIIFNRKLLIKLFKNQINCLFLSFEYNFN